MAVGSVHVFARFNDGWGILTGLFGDTIADYIPNTEYGSYCRRHPSLVEHLLILPKVNEALEVRVEMQIKIHFWFGLDRDQGLMFWVYGGMRQKNLCHFLPILPQHSWFVVWQSFVSLGKSASLVQMRNLASTDTAENDRPVRVDTVVGFRTQHDPDVKAMNKFI